MGEWNIKRRGYNFKFRNPYFEDDTLMLEYKVEGVCENNENDGYFRSSYGAYFKLSDSAIRMRDIKINGVTIDGIKLTEKMTQEFIDMNENYKAEKKELIEKLATEVAKGERMVEFHFSDSNYEHYEPKLSNLPGKEKYNLYDTDVLETAIKIIAGKKKIILNSRDYLKGILGVHGTTLKKVKASVNAKNIKNIKIAINGITVASFEMTLRDVMSKVLGEYKDIEKRKAEMTVTVTKKETTKNQNGYDHHADIIIRDNATGEEEGYYCANIYDIGYIINAKHKVSKEFDARAKSYLKQFPPVKTI